MQLLDESQVPARPAAEALVNMGGSRQRTNVAQWTEATKDVLPRRLGHCLLFTAQPQRRIEDDATWLPRTFDPAEPGSIDMWLGPTTRPITQPQARSGQPAEAGRTAP